MGHKRIVNEQEESNQRTRVYRMKSGQRFVGIVLLTVGLFFGVAIWGGVITGVREPNFLEMMFPIVLSLIAGVFTVRTFRNSVHLSETAIELRSISGHKQLPFDKIKGRRK